MFLSVQLLAIASISKERRRHEHSDSRTRRQSPPARGSSIRSTPALGFAVEYMAGTFHGALAPFASVTLSDDGTATLVGSARVENIQVGDDELRAHLASPEFFDAEQAPEFVRIRAVRR